VRAHTAPRPAARDIAGPARRRPPRRARLAALSLARAPQILVVGLIAGTGLASVLGRGGAWVWWLDLLAHFRIQYAALLLISLALAAALRSRRLVIAAAALLVLELVPLAHYAVPGDRSAAGPSLRLAHFNVLSANREHAQVQAWVVETGAELVFLQEVTPRWAEVLAATPNHRLIEVVAREDNFGLAILTRDDAAVEIVEREQLEFAGLPALAVQLRHHGRALAVLSLHTLPPLSAATSARRDAQLVAAAQWAATQRAAGAAAVILGDFNATPFSAALAPLTAAGLQDSLSAGGLLVAGSWPDVIWPLRIAIDHCWHDARLVTLDRTIGPALGSDHRPLQVTLAWATGP